MKLNKKWMIALLALGPVTGCVEPIVMDPEEKDMPIVVNCILSFESVNYNEPGECENPKLTLQFAKGKAQNEYIPVEDAVVYLEGKFSTLPFVQVSTIPFVHKGGCNWEIEQNIRLLFDSNYKLVVEIPGKEPIWAETRTPPEVHFTVSEHKGAIAQEYVFGGSEFEGLALWATGHIVDELYVLKERDSAKSLDYLVTNHPYADDFNICSKKYSDLSFEGTPHNQCGKYYLDSFNRAKRELSVYPLHEGVLRIGNLEYGKPFFIFPGPLAVPYDFYGTTGAQAYSFVEYHFITEDFDKYLRSVYVHNLSIGSDMSSIYSSSNDIYSNIVGGLGVFGSCYNTRAYFLTNEEGIQGGPEWTIN